MNPYDIIFRGKYIWHKQKNERNIREHKIAFEEAVDVFDDPFAIEEYDVGNSDTEERYNVTGHVQGRMIVVTVTMTLRGELIRIISARDADPLEQEAYDDSVKKHQGE